MAANVVYHKAMKKMYEGGAGFNMLGDIRLILVMTNTTCDTQNDAIEFLDEFTALDEYDGTGYARLALSTATPTFVADTTRNSNKLQCASHPAFPTLSGDGTRNVQGVLYYWNVLADDTQSVPFLYAPYTTPRVPDGGTFTVELPTDKVVIEFFQAATATAPITND
jgi:hypothetical protein